MGSLAKARRIDQAGERSIAECLEASWRAGVVRYDVELIARSVTYYGCEDKEYVEEYPALEDE